MQNDKNPNAFSWDETFMQICRVIAKRSKDPNTQNGACIVNPDNIIIGLGYNGFPRGCSDDHLPWAREGEFGDKKYAYVVHAEENAVLNANTDTKGAKLYCTLFPCNECAKVTIQRGIKEIIYESDKYHDDPIWVASRRLLDLAGVTYRQFIPENEIEFKKK
jgi:dCMP deaminase